MRTCKTIRPWAVFGILAALITFAHSSPDDDEKFADFSHYDSVQGHYDEDYKGLYQRASQLTAETRRTLPHHLNVVYGSDENQKMDIYLPKTKVANAPVLIFFHGGGFSEGDRSFYGFIARPYAAREIITVIVGYRLSTQGFTYPSQVADAKNAIVWVNKHIAEYGGDGDALFIVGHSAGAILGAEIGVDLEWLQAARIPSTAIKGIAVVSGRYDLLKESDLTNYVPTPELAIAASPVLHIQNPCNTWILGYGTKFTREGMMGQPARTFAELLKHRASDVKIVVETGADHVGTVMALGTKETPLSEAVLAMIKPKHLTRISLEEIAK